VSQPRISSERKTNTLRPLYGLTFFDTNTANYRLMGDGSDQHPWRVLGRTGSAPFPAIHYDRDEQRQKERFPPNTHAADTTIHGAVLAAPFGFHIDRAAAGLIASSLRN